MKRKAAAWYAVIGVLVVAAAVTVALSVMRSNEKAGGGVFTQEEAGITFRIDMPEIETFMESSIEGPIVPALNQNAIPQGIAYLEEKNWIIISYYREEEQPSLLAIVDAESGRMVKALYLAHRDSTPYVGHAGGVTVSRKHIWVSSDRNAYWIPIEDVIEAENESQVKFGGFIATDTRASFTTYGNGILWVGEYAQGTDYPTEESHYLINREGVEHRAWAAGFRLDEETDRLRSSADAGALPATPDYIISLPDRVQGMHMLQDRVWLSRSYGRNNAGTLSEYKLDMKEKPHLTAAIGEQDVPVWFLDGQNVTVQHEIPPMSEGIVEHGAKMYILFESGAAKYKTSSSYALDRILIWNID